MTLVFLEIIELNCFDLQENTKRNINKRAKLDGDKEINLFNVKHEDIDIDNYKIEIN